MVGVERGDDSLREEVLRGGGRWGALCHQVIQAQSTEDVTWELL